MTISNEDELLIEKFQEKTLTDDEKRLFKHKFENDPIFANAVRSYSEELLILTASEANQEVKESKIQVISISRVAAAVLFLCVAAFVFIYVNDPDNEEVAYITFRQNTSLAFSLVDNLRNAQPSQNHDDYEEIVDISAKYLTGQKLQALEKLEKLLAGNNDNPKLKLALADLYFELQKPQKAAILYDGLLKENFNQPHIRYRLSLSYLASGDKAKCILLLNELITLKTSPYDQKASRLLSRIQSLRATLHIGNWF